MNITRAIAGWCPNGDDCDVVYDIDDAEDVLVRGRFVAEPVYVDGEPLRLPAHEGLMRIKRSVYYGGRS